MAKGQGQTETISDRELARFSLEQRVRYLEAMCETLRAQRTEALARIDILEIELSRAKKYGYDKGICYGHE